MTTRPVRWRRTLQRNAAAGLRTATDRVRTASEEPVTKAFNRLKNDLDPLLRYRDVNVQFVERARTAERGGTRCTCRRPRCAILAFIDQPDVSRIRVQWDCDGKNLLIDIRDDGTPGLATESEQVQPLSQRVAALHGSLSIATTEGWGSEMSVVLPLEPPATQGDRFAPWVWVRVTWRSLSGLPRGAQQGDRSRSRHQREHGQVPRLEDLPQARRHITRAGGLHGVAEARSGVMTPLTVKVMTLLGDGLTGSGSGQRKTTV